MTDTPPPVPTPSDATPPPAAPTPPPAQPVYPAYGQPAPGYYAPPTNTMAILALVFGFVFAPVGIVLGHLALGQIKRTGESGRGLALAGVIVGYALVGFFFLLVLFFVVAVSLSSSTSSNF